MTFEILKALLKTTGYDVAYSKSSTAPTIPFITYTATAGERGSDEKNLIEELNARVELYTNKKDLVAERKVKDVLNFTEFDNDETYIDTEKMYMNVYTFMITQKIKE